MLTRALRLSVSFLALLPLPVLALCLLLFLLAASTACGARTDVGGSDASAGGPDDAGPPPRDAGRRDAGPPPFDAGPPPFDAGMPPPCEALVPLSEPVVVHEDSAGVLGSTQAVFRAGGFDLVATFSTILDDRTDDARVRRLTVTPGGAVTLGDVVTLGFVPLAPVSAAARGGELGLLSSVSTGAAEPEARLWRYTGSRFDLAGEAAVWEGRAVDVEARGGRWLAAIHGPGTIGSATFVLVLDREGDLVSMPLSAVDPSLPGFEEARVQATAMETGFAWVSSPLDAAGRYEVAFMRDLEPIRVRRNGAPPVVLDAARPLGIAPSPWLRGDALVAGYDFSALFLASVGPTGGWTSTSLAFSMVGDVSPALVSGPFGAVLGAMHFGDADPTGGQLEVHWLWDRAEPLAPPLAFEARRAGDFGEASIDAATDGELVVLHYTHYDVDRATWQTRAIVLECE